jgi:predicted nucleic acid-binding protein
LLDYKLVCEYREVALRPRHLLASGRSAREVEEVIDALESVALPVLVEIKPRPMSQDENDNMVLDVAVNGRADAVVTNNVKDFASAAGRFGIRVLTPAELLIEIRKGLHDARKEERAK